MSKINWDKDKSRRLSEQTVRHSIEKERNAHIDAMAKHIDKAFIDKTLALKTMSSLVVTITPELAAKWLEGNTHNRPLVQQNVNAWTKDMAAGRWVLNGESIIFDISGKLMDGQHRLWACVESNTAFESIVVFNAPVEAFITIDQGKHRSPADHLVVAGLTPIKNRASFAATAVLFFRYKKNQMFSNFKVRPDELLHTVKEHPALVEWNTKCRRGPTKLHGFGTQLAVVLYVGSKKYPQEAEQFLDQWITGAGLETGSPVLALRQRVLNNSPKQGWERAYLAVTAWNAFIRKRPMFKTGTLKGPDFPRILGDD